MDLILRSPHQNILDIGPGFGKYGVLCREYCDLIPSWFEKGLDGFDKNNWQIKIDCIEPCEKYITPLHRYIYDHIYTEKAEDVIELFDDYDLILLIGTLEHLEKDKGVFLLKQCQKKAKAIVLTTPNGFVKQRAEWGNPLEEHRSGWSINDLKDLHFECQTLMSDNKIIAYWRKDAPL